MWKACERFGILPPDMKSNKWDDLNVIDQAMLISYNQIREVEEWESQAQ